MISIKKLLYNLTIKTRLNIMAGSALVSLLFVGFAANYFFQTSKVVGVIVNIERVYIVNLQIGIEKFYQYIISGDEEDLENSLSYIDKANEMAFVYSKIDSLIMNSPEEKWKHEFFETFHEGLYDQFETAELLGRRVRLMKRMGAAKLDESIKQANRGYEIGIDIRHQIIEYSENEHHDDLDKLRSSLDTLHVMYHDFADAMNEIQKFIHTILITLLTLLITLLGLLSAIFLLLLSKSISNPLNELIDTFKIMAQGNLKSKITYNAKDEIGDLARAFRKIQLGLLDMLSYSKNISQGDFSYKIKPKSDDDELAISLNKMAVDLKVSKTKTDQQHWFNEGSQQLNSEMVGDLHVNELSEKVLSFLAHFLDIELAALYAYTEEGKRIFRTETYGFDNALMKKEYELGEGIIGQVGKNQTTKIINIPQSHHIISYTSGEVTPQQIAFIPLIYNDKLRGILEIASVEKLSQDKIDFLHKVSRSIAINIRTAITSRRLMKLLEKTSEQANELQVQQEELRVANEELAEQTKVLIANEKNLQVQQEELRVSNEELEERTSQLELQKKEITDKNSKLEEARNSLEIKAKELAQISQYKSEFMANMSHELRTPLNSLLILSRMMSENKKGNLEADQVKSMKIIHKSGTDLLNLINEILDLSKIEAGKMTIDFHDVRIKDLKTEIALNFDPVAKEKKLDFSIELSEEVPDVVHTDHQRVMQIVKNLLSNAFKFTSKGHIKVNMGLADSACNMRSMELIENGAYFISVQDTGVGIPDNKKEAIFDAFQQADGSISRRFGGTGLGLSISKEFSTLLGGEIHLTSEEGKGSIFTIYLPLGKNHAKKNDEIARNVIEKKVTSISSVTSAITIEEEKSPKSLPYFIDDDRGSANESSMILIIHPHKLQATKLLEQCHSRNFKAIVGQTVQEGILLAEHFNPKAILISLDPKVYQDIEQLQENHSTSHLPVHVITPFDNESSGGSIEELKTLEAMSFDSEFDKVFQQFDAPSRKILIVEDDYATRLVIHQLLEKENVSIMDADTGEKAYQAIQKEEFDCIILDLGLPDFSGKELLNRLKAHNQKIPNTIIYTGREITIEEHRELQKFTNSIVIKGVKSDERLMDEVTLFLHQVANKLPEKKKKVETAPEGNTLFKGKKILVVDDDIRNTFALAQILEEKEIEVVEAENGLVALDVLSEINDIDLVLMDIMMPEMDGYEAMKEIRKRDNISEIPIITLTAKAMKDDYDKAIRAGANDYITKPVDEDKLFSLLQIWLYQ